MEYWQYYLSPLGFLKIIASQKQIIAINFVSKKQKNKSSTLTQRCSFELQEYFFGRRQNFSLPLLIMGTDFQKQVYRALLKIPYAQVIAYSDLARMIGRPKAARAVGQALNANRIPIIIPCHRVLAIDGKSGGYSEGLSKKSSLLALEKHFD